MSAKLPRSAGFAAWAALLLQGCVAVSVSEGPLGSAEPLDPERLAKARDAVVRDLGPNVAIEVGEDFKARWQHQQRYEELDGLFGKALAAEASLEYPGVWELHPDILYFRATLVQVALAREASCREPRTTGTGLVPAQPSPATCAATILTNRCLGVGGQLCVQLRRKAHDLCVAVTTCQTACDAGDCVP